MVDRGLCHKNEHRIDISIPIVTIIVRSLLGEIRMIRVAVVDDHPHVAIAVETLLIKVPDIQLVAKSKHGSELQSLVKDNKPDILLLDLLLEPEFDALSAINHLIENFPILKICVLSAFVKPALIQRLLQAGVHGYILKDDDYISKIDSILRNLYDGDVYLSPQATDALIEAARTKKGKQVLTERELEILRLAKQGLSNPQIAEVLYLAVGTVRNHLDYDL